MKLALLLRGVNVGTKNSLPMAELRAMLEGLGCREVRTLLQSGNAVFAVPEGVRAADGGQPADVAELKGAIEAALARYMGRPIATTWRTAAEMQAIEALDPLGKVATDPSRSCVMFFEHALAPSDLAPLEACDWAPEAFHLAGRELYTWHPNGQARSVLATAIGKLPLRVMVTTRNWNTVRKLAAMLRDGEPGA